MKWLRVSLVAQAILACYFQAVQWLPLGNWNTQCPSGDEVACGLGHQGLSVPGFQPLSVLASAGRLSISDVLYCVAFTLPFWAFLFAFVRDLRWLMWLQVAVYSAWMALQVKSWWVPYLLGATDRQAERYQAVFASSTQLLPSFGRHLPPDGLHLVLQVLGASALIPAVVGLLKTSSRARARR